MNTKKVTEELTENVYSNEAYKQYLTSDSRQDYVHQNTKVSSTSTLTTLSWYDHIKLKQYKDLFISITVNTVFSPKTLLVPA